MANGTLKFRQYLGVIDCHDLDTYVKEKLGQAYGTLHSYACEAGTGSYYTVYASPERPENYTVEEAEELLAKWRATVLPTASCYFREEHDDVLPDVDVILWELCRNGHLAEGEYLLLVWW